MATIINNNKILKINPISINMPNQDSISSIDKPQVFISFSFNDKQFAEWLAEKLQERGIRTWVATHE